MRVSCISPLSARFCAILCNSGKIGEAVPKKPPKKTPDPGPSGCFQAVEIPFPHRGTRQRTAKVQPGFHPFPPDSAPFHLSAIARRIVGKGFAGALRGVCMALAGGGATAGPRRAARQERAWRASAVREAAGAVATAGAARPPDQRARPAGATAQGGFTRRSGNRQPEGRRCVGVDAAAPCPPAVCPLWRDPQKGGIWKGGFQRGKTEGGNGVAGAARRVEHPPLRGLGGKPRARRVRCRPAAHGRDGRRSRTRPGDVRAADREAGAGAADSQPFQARRRSRRTGRSRGRNEAPPEKPLPWPCARIGGAPHERRGGSGPRRPQGQARGARPRSGPAEAPRASGGAAAG